MTKIQDKWLLMLVTLRHLMELIFLNLIQTETVLLTMYLSIMQDTMKLKEVRKIQFGRTAGS